MRLISLTTIFLITFFISCSVDCKAYFDFARDIEMKGEVTKFSVYGRYVTLGLKYKGKEEIDHISIPELYINEDKIHVGDTLIKESGELRWFIHTKHGVDTIYTECGDLHGPYNSEGQPIGE